MHVEYPGKQRQDARHLLDGRIAEMQVYGGMQDKARQDKLDLESY